MDYQDYVDGDGFDGGDGQVGVVGDGEQTVAFLVASEASIRTMRKMMMLGGTCVVNLLHRSPPLVQHVLAY